MKTLGASQNVAYEYLQYVIVKNNAKLAKK